MKNKEVFHKVLQTMKFFKIFAGLFTFMLNYIDKHTILRGGELRGSN